MYPVMMNIRGKRVVIIGGGKVAARKIKSLLMEEADILLISPNIHSSIPQSEITWIKRCYKSGDLEGAKLIFACTDDPIINQRIMDDAQPTQFVNNTGDKNNSDFYNVAVASNNELSVMISTYGLSPSRSKQVREKVERLLDQL